MTKKYFKVTALLLIVAILCSGAILVTMYTSNIDMEHTKLLLGEVEGIGEVLAPRIAEKLVEANIYTYRAQNLKLSIFSLIVILTLLILTQYGFYVNIHLSQQHNEENINNHAETHDLIILKGDEDEKWEEKTPEKEELHNRD